MDLRQLEMFKTVAELKGFTRAGEKLHVSHSAISRQIRLLEDELQGPLFIRANKRVSLTEAGRVLLGHVRPILKQLAQAADSVSQVSQPRVGRLNLGTGTTMLRFFLPPVFKEFKGRYPGVTVHIRTGPSSAILGDLRGGTLDVVILPIATEGCDLLIQPLYREELVAVVGNHHPFATKKSIRPDELNDFPLIAFPAHSTTRRTLDDLFRRLKISPTVQLEVENDEAVEKAITACFAVSFLPKRRASHDRIHFLRIVGHRVSRNVGLVTLGSKKASKDLAYFSTLCCEHAKRMFPFDCLCTQTLL
jgi:DNA-binding transcriptional LysR family regulator